MADPTAVILVVGLNRSLIGEDCPTDQGVCGSRVGAATGAGGAGGDVQRAIKHAHGVGAWWAEGTWRRRKRVVRPRIRGGAVLEAEQSPGAR